MRLSALFSVFAIITGAREATAAPAANAFTSPVASTVLSAGDVLVITWENISGATATLQLAKGDPCDLVISMIVARDICNEGLLEWVVPDCIEPGKYSMMIQPDNGAINYSAFFRIVARDPNRHGCGPYENQYQHYYPCAQDAPSRQACHKQSPPPCVQAQHPAACVHEPVPDTGETAESASAQSHAYIPDQINTVAYPVPEPAYAPTTTSEAHSPVQTPPSTLTPAQQQSQTMAKAPQQSSVQAPEKAPVFAYPNTAAYPYGSYQQLPPASDYSNSESSYIPTTTDTSGSHCHCDPADLDGSDVLREEAGSKDEGEGEGEEIELSQLAASDPRSSLHPPVDLKHSNGTSHDPEINRGDHDHPEVDSDGDDGSHDEDRGDTHDGPGDIDESELSAGDLSDPSPNDSLEGINRGTNDTPVDTAEMADGGADQTSGGCSESPDATRVETSSDAVPFITVLLPAYTVAPSVPTTGALRHPRYYKHRGTKSINKAACTGTRRKGGRRKDRDCLGFFHRLCHGN